MNFVKYHQNHNGIGNFLLLLSCCVLFMAHLCRRSSSRANDNIFTRSRDGQPKNRKTFRTLKTANPVCRLTSMSSVRKSHKKFSLPLTQTKERKNYFTDRIKLIVKLLFSREIIIRVAASVVLKNFLTLRHSTTFVFNLNA